MMPPKHCQLLRNYRTMGGSGIFYFMIRFRNKFSHFDCIRVVYSVFIIIQAMPADHVLEA